MSQYKFVTNMPKLSQVEVCYYLLKIISCKTSKLIFTDKNNHQLCLIKLVVLCTMCAVHCVSTNAPELLIYLVRDHKGQLTTKFATLDELHLRLFKFKSGLYSFIFSSNRSLFLLTKNFCRVIVTCEN